MLKVTKNVYHLEKNSSLAFSDYTREITLLKPPPCPHKKVLKIYVWEEKRLLEKGKIVFPSESMHIYCVPQSLENCHGVFQIYQMHSLFLFRSFLLTFIKIKRRSTTDCKDDISDYTKVLLKFLNIFFKPENIT